MEPRKQNRTNKEQQIKMSDKELQFFSFRSVHQSESPCSDSPESKVMSPPVVVANRSVRDEEVAARVMAKLRHPQFDGGFSGDGEVEGGGGGGEKRLTVASVNRLVREEVAGRVMAKLGHPQFEGDCSGDGEVEVGGGGGERRPAVVGMPQRWSMRVKRAELVLRVSEVIVCMISFWVMVSDKARGWSGDSFDRYKEFRYCAAVTVIAFVYSTFQACYLVCVFIIGKYLFHPLLTHHFDFAMDQILAYLLISASSAAATRAEDWASNWGEDVFTEMATASVGMSFIAFAAFALSSLVSGYNLLLSHRSSSAS